MKKGLTLIETIVVIAIAFALIYGIVNVMKNLFDSYWISSDTAIIQNMARTAINEMTRFIRQSSNPVTGIDPGIGETKTYIQFVYVKDESETRNMKYYKNGKKLMRVVDGSTTTLISNYLDSIYFTHVSSYVVKIQSMTLTKGDQSITLDKTIFIRNR
ncbi:MAG: hypothetical protein DRI36_03150 [Caldiserica bacterium]|nr:MAG: hypothetical protein DRI36_03150 [Caldisericota bacterium]